jgi:flagellar FliJ protein
VAKRFRFRLETLLKVRELREREAKRNVAAKRAEIARLDQLDEQTATEIRRHQSVLLAAQQSGALDPVALQRGRAWIGHLRKTITLRHIQRQTLLEQLAERQAQWREARKQMRVLEKLKERRWDEHRRKEERLERAALDELAQQMHVPDVR